MLKRLIHWLARDEISAEWAAFAKEMAAHRYEVAAHGCVAYASGFVAGRVVGQSEMLAQLRGKPEDKVTSFMMQQSAKWMVN